MMRRVAEIVRSQGTDHTLLLQGELPREQLLDLFREDLHSILFGVHSFWQGVDVPGEALECVIIAKLPFDVPTDPINEAKMEALAEAGLDPFANHLLPQAVMMLRQGVGRLIRTRDDRGLIAILDPRVKTRSYGRHFLNSLPPCPVTESKEDVDRFFQTGIAED
jgi:ATP-dependent DNA helicase DinG